MDPKIVLDHLDRGTPWSFDRVPSQTDVAAAYRDALALRALRVARGERPVGYKIGFTNRTIWSRYQVFAPIWGTVWDTTLRFADGAGTLDLTATCQPRIEPEIVFGIAATPPHDATQEQLFASIDWLAPGFEIVQSHRPDWKFTAADTVADGGLHARLLVGRRTPVATYANTGAALDDRLASTTLRLFRGDTPIDEGRGANVLDGPLHALHHFVRELAACPGAPCLMPGDVVTTGTWTDAWPVAPGETWRSAFDPPFASLEVVFANRATP